MIDLDAVKAELATITPGPWSKPYWDDYPGDRGWWIHNGRQGTKEYAVALTFTGNPKQEQDAQFIAKAPTLVADLVAEVERQQSHIDKVAHLADGVDDPTYREIMLYDALTERDDLRVQVEQLKSAGGWQILMEAKNKPLLDEIERYKAAMERHGFKLEPE